MDNNFNIGIFGRSFDAHRQVLSASAECCAHALEKLSDISAEALLNGSKLLFFGNGGSAADAQHLATELTVRFVRDRCALAAIALTTDSSALTACGNDLGFEQIFSIQIEALGASGDVAIGFSTSGNSPNVIRALQCARGKGLVAAALTGNNGGKLNGVADPLIIVPSNDTARIQEMHILLGHILCAEIETRLGLA
jgi:D-sedoheptulose 7-phosphate isomerase